MKTGNCLCGAVTVTVKNEANDLGACHCDLCRKWAGGPFLELECGANVIFAGTDNIAIFRSSEWAERGFCKVCGSHLFIKSLESGEYGVPPGLFAGDDVIFNRQVFFDRKPAYYSFSNATRNISSDDIYARYPHLRKEPRDSELG